ncbi:hypothetical protein LSCM1_02042 [Leishmania martiniquensis]|uniref:Uncharacterized protein n=1 Tax=Leishmania martiniquensis TaxID=1580590 RepID=A0A836GN54_9TRYP|nr:hypothetical protein LSCM1_02042 [Leishmania martiniquensis]
MSGTERLTDAFWLQFQWVPVLITDRSHHTSGERKRCALFAVMHVAFLLVLFGHFLSIVVSWALAFIMQAGAMGLCLMHLAMLEEYADRMNNALELEHVVNPFIVGGVAVRCFACLQCILTRSWLLFLAGSVEILYDLYVAQQRSLLIDGTTIWKEIRTYRIDGRIRLGYQVVMVVASVLYLLFSIFTM